VRVEYCSAIEGRFKFPSEFEAVVERFFGKAYKPGWHHRGGINAHFFLQFGNHLSDWINLSRFHQSGPIHSIGVNQLSTVRL
jgi:hypothetical protein